MNLVPHHTAVIVRDLDSSLSFYKKLGFREVYRHESGDIDLVLVNLMLKDYIIELIWYPQNRDKERLNSGSSRWKGIGVEHFGLKTEDIETTLAELKKIGIAAPETEIINGRTEVRYFFVEDPDGVRVEIVEDKRF